MDEMQILLVEDNPADAELISRVLTRAGLAFAIRRVTSESSFRRELVARTPDVILSDYHLPSFDGVTALNIARTLAPDVPFIFVSGTISDERATRALQEGAIDFIVKDRPARLAEAVRRAITERRDRARRRDMQAALRLSEQRFHLAALATLDVIWDYDVAHQRVVFNDAINTLWGYDLDGEVDYDWWLSRIHPDDLDGLVASLQRLMASPADRWSSEYRFRRADGMYRNVLDRGLVVRGDGGKPVRMIGAMQDFTEREAAEQRATGAERLARLGRWTRDLSTGRCTWSDETYGILGLPRDTPPTMERFIDAIHPDDRDAAVAAMHAAAPIECRIVRPDGAVRVIHGRIGEVTDGKLVGTMQDITERAEAERTIRSLSKQNELILQHAAEGIVGVDAEGKLTFVNRAAVALAGWPEGELLPGVLSHSVIHADRACTDCGIVKTLGDGEQRMGEDVLRRRDGERLDIEYSCAAIRNEGRITGAVVTFRDVTSRKRLERQLDQVRRVSSLGRIAATIAHEFNNVLMGISPFVEVIRRRAGTDEQLKDAAGHILTSVARGRKITEEILRTTQDRQPAAVSVEMREWLPRIASEVEALAGEGVSLVTTISDEPFFARFDPEQIAQVLLNLAANARDAMNGTGTLTIEASPDEPSRSVHIAVCDTGIGIPAGVLPHIFEPLFTTKSKGTGLGLAVAQQMVVRNGGAISVASRVGAGTRFEITLPMGEPPRKTVVAPAIHGDAVPVRRLLVVDDEPAVAAGLTALLALDDVDVYAVGSGAATLDAIRSFAPEAVVLDVSLPDADGGEVYDRIAEHWPDLPVIFSTGNGDATRLSRQLARPRVRFLRKPYDAKALLEALRSIV